MPQGSQRNRQSHLSSTTSVDKGNPTRRPGSRELLLAALASSFSCLFRIICKVATLLAVAAATLMLLPVALLAAFLPASFAFSGSSHQQGAVRHRAQLAPRSHARPDRKILRVAVPFGACFWRIHRLSRYRIFARQTAYRSGLCPCRRSRRHSERRAGQLLRKSRSLLPRLQGAVRPN